MATRTLRPTFIKICRGFPLGRTSLRFSRTARPTWATIRRGGSRFVGAAVFELAENNSYKAVASSGSSRLDGYSSIRSTLKVAGLVDSTCYTSRKSFRYEETRHVVRC